jgi:hypothetical protein
MGYHGISQYLKHLPVRNEQLRVTVIVVVEGEWKAGGLTMHNLWFQLQGSIHTMELIAGLVADISARQVPVPVVSSRVVDPD